MPSASQTIKYRHRRYSKESSSLGLMLGLLSGILTSLALVAIIFVGANVYIQLTQSLTIIDSLPSLLEPSHGLLLQPTRFYDRTHQQIILTLENPAATNKQYISLSLVDGKISDQAFEYLADATIASIDPEYWNEPGNVLSIFSQSAQPILAQKLIDNLRSVNEMSSAELDFGQRLLTFELVGKYGRLQILEWYLNTAQYGKLIYGANAAAQAYFGKSAAQLSLAEAAVLTGFMQNPSLDPSEDNLRIREMQVQVIIDMLGHGYIGTDQAHEALKENIQFQPQIEPESLSPQYTNLVLQQISQVVPLKQLYQGGFDVVTSLDYELQNQAICAARVEQAFLQADSEQATSVKDSLCETVTLLSESPENAVPSTHELKSEVVILSPDNGQILAMLGDSRSKLLPGYPQQHPVGTILSPLLYLTAFAQGMSPASLLWDVPFSEGGGSNAGINQAYQPDWSSYYGPVSLRAAINNDYYGAAAGLYQQLGAENVWRVENQFGILQQESPSTAPASIDDFYSQKASLLEITRAYGVLANQGFMAGQTGESNLKQKSHSMINPITLLSITGPDGKTWLETADPETILVVSTPLAFLTTNVLSGGEVHQTDPALADKLVISRPVAVKTGTSTDGSSTWAVGFTAQLVVGVWIGETQPGYVLSSEPVGALWQAIIKYATKELPRQDFLEPPGISHVLVCEPSGMLPSTVCPSVKDEIFLYGSEPTQVDDLFREYWVNRQTGLLATIFTPTELVDRNVYLSVPTQAVEWAKQTNFPTPPENYDNYPPPHSADAEIGTPAMNSYIRGRVNFYGSAGGDNFAYYRLQVGEGVYPQEWVQIGTDINQPVHNGLLGTWDTNGLQGEYLVQLLIVKQDKQIEQAYTYLFADNTAPSLQIVSPEDNEIFQTSHDKTIIFQAAAEDDFSLEKVKFVLDDQLIATLYESPYVVSWSAELGRHKLQITAYDQAENYREQTITFSVTQ
jgi:membrane carboxypeptidase/penicillin-binding protein